MVKIMDHSEFAQKHLSRRKAEIKCCQKFAPTNDRAAALNTNDMLVLLDSGCSQANL